MSSILSPTQSQEISIKPPHAEPAYDLRGKTYTKLMGLYSDALKICHLRDNFLDSKPRARSFSSTN